MIGCACKSWLESRRHSVLSSPKSCQSPFFMIGHVRSLVIAEPASDRMQPAAFASGHLTGCAQSPWPLVSFTSRGASLHLVNKASMQPHTPSLWLRVHAMLIYFYPSQSACNERTQDSLSLYAIHVCSPFALA
jgi:hypothetical protein